MSEIKVKIGPLYGDMDSPAGKVKTESFGVWRCDAFHDDFPSGMLHIGMIGRQDGANFCENHEFSKFTPEQKASMVAQIKEQHGSASPDAPHELAEDISQEFDEEDGDELDTDVIEDDDE